MKKKRILNTILCENNIKKYINLKDKNGKLTLKKHTPKNILKTQILSNNLDQITKIFKNEKYSKSEFCKTMLKVLNFPIEEFLHILACLNDLFLKISIENGSKKKITFKDLINYTLKDLKNLNNLSFKLNMRKSFINENKNLKNKEFINNLYFKSPLIKSNKKINYISLDKNSLITNSKAFKSPVKICLYDSSLLIFIISWEEKNSLSIFKQNGNFIKEVIPKKKNNLEIGVLSIGFSCESCQMAVLLMDNSVSLWEFPTFDFELNFDLPTKIFQEFIFFSQIYSKFCTLEEEFVLNIWDLNQVVIDKRIVLKKSEKKKNRLVFFKEILSLNLFFITTKNKQFFIFDTKLNQIVLEKKLIIKSVTNIIFAINFQAIILLSHDINILVLKIVNKDDFFEINFVGNLVGHLNYITSGTFLQKQGILVTVDESANVKFWDIEKMCCLKNFEIMGKALIKNIYFIKSSNSLALISRKINIYKINNNIVKNPEAIENSILEIYLDKLDNFFIIFRKFDFIIIDSENGRQIVIKKYNVIETYKNHIEATFIKVVNKGKNFYLGDSKGNIFFLNLDLDILYKLKNHNKKIKKLYILKNNNYLTFSENDYFVQKKKNELGCQENIILRKLKNIFQNENPLKIIEFNIDMNLILLCNNSSELFIINFEFGRIHGILKFDSKFQILQVKMHSKYGLIFIYLSSNQVILMGFSFDPSFSELKLKFKVIDVFTNENLKNKGKVLSSVLRFKKFEKEDDFDKLNFILGFESGEVVIIGINDKKMKFKRKNSYLEKNSFNSARHFNGKFTRKNISNVYCINNNLKTNNIICFKNSFKVFKNGIGKLKIINQSKDFMFLVDKKFQYFFKLLDFKGNCLVSYNLSFHLPLVWKFKYDYIYFKGKSFYEGLKIFEELYNQKKQCSNFKTLTKSFVKHIKEEKKLNRKKVLITNINNNNKENIITMEVYDPIIILEEKYQKLFKEKKSIFKRDQLKKNRIQFKL